MAPPAQVDLDSLRNAVVKVGAADWACIMPGDDARGSMPRPGPICVRRRLLAGPGAQG
jgi:hypothetical protein